jgi:PAS domain S-box-containing protein
LQELKVSTKQSTQELTGRSVTIFFDPDFITLTGRWHWDFAADSVFCSNVMVSLEQEHEAAKGIIHPDDVDKVKEKLQEDKIRYLEFRLITTYGEVRQITGERLTVHSRTSFLNEAKDELRELGKNAVARKELQDLLLFKEVYEKSARFTNTGIWWYNEATNETWYSAEVFRIYQLAPFSLNPHLNTFLSFIHPKDRDVVEEYTNRSYNEKTPLHIEYRIQTAVGEKYVQHISQWMFSANGESILSGMLRDITEEKKKEKELEGLEQRSAFFKQKLSFDEQNSGIAHWHVNLITRKFVFSPNYPGLFGLKGKAIADLSGYSDYIHPDDRGDYQLAIKKMLNEHSVPEINFRIYRGDGKLRYFSQKAKLVTDGTDLVMIGSIEDVTVKTLLQNKTKELSEAEAVRSFAQQHFEEMASMAGWVWNTTDNIIQWSENFYSLLGLKKNSKEITHKIFLSQVHPGDRNFFKDQMNFLLEQKQENSFDFRLQQWGRTKYIKASFRLMRHDEKDLFIAVFRDVSKERSLEEALNDRVQLAEAISENILDRIIITDVHNTIKLWNKACEQAYEKGVDEVLGKNFFDVFPHLKTEEEIGLFSRVLKGERIFLEASKSAAERGYYDLYLLPVWNNEQSEVNGIVHIIHDVTREMELQRNLAERFSFIESLVESSPDHVIALDRNMNYLIWNKKSEEYYGLKKEDVIGKNVLEVFPTAHNTPAYDNFRRVLRGETVHLPASSESSRYEVYLLPVKNEKGDIHAILWIEHDLSKEIESEKQLKAQAQLLETVFNASTNGIILFKVVRDAEKSIVDYEVIMDNAITQKWNGRSLVGLKYVQLFPSVKETGVFDAYNKVIETGEPLDMEIFYEGQGFKNWFRITAVKMDNDQLVATAEDITERKKTEEELIESRHLLEQTAKASPDSITIYDLQKKHPLYLNNCLAEWLGIDADELLNMGIDGRLELIHPDDRLKLLHHNEKTAASKDNDITHLEYRIRTRDGKTIWLRNRSKPFQRDASGRVVHILSVLQNVTEEIELREELKQRSQFAEAILDASIDRVTVFDTNYRFVGWNRRCEQIHGKRKEDVIGKTIFEMFPGVENYPEFMNSQEQSLRGEFVHVPMVRDGYTGDYLELFYIPLKDENGETYAVVNIMHDVSDFVVATDQLTALNRKLETKNSELEQKTEEITSFAFVASHDMKEPLRKIHTFADWLQETEREWLTQQGKTVLDKLHASVKRMEHLIDDIFVLTKIHSDMHREEDVDLNNMLTQVMDDMADQINETGSVIHAKKLPVIKANSNQLFYLFKNLISNAIKFQKPGSVPQVTITYEIVEGKEVKLNETGEEYLKLSFADNGFGFDQRYAKKIFQVFQRLHGKHEFEGTGIGLAICKKIIENHNGTITVKSEEGKGSVFSCYFPLH